MENYAHFSQKFAAHLKAYTASLSNKVPQELYAPEAYILSLGGKRVRPLLTLVGNDLFGGNPDNALNAALAVELFHNFSLIHDDILDAAPLRRGKDTVHIKWNTNIAILSGDAMLVKSSQVLDTYEPQQYRALNKLFLRTAIDVCEGQQLDMNFENRNNVSVDEYITMITLKTAVLLGCSLQMGAITASADEDAQKHLYEFGKHIGIAFQLLDDLLDAYAEEESGFGKQIGGDILANKKTFLTLKAFELASDEQKKQLTSIIALSPNQEKVAQMLGLYNSIGVAQRCREEANMHTNIAIEALSALGIDQKKKTDLIHFALNLLGRQK